MAEPLTEAEERELRETLAAEHIDLKCGRAGSMQRALEMQRDGYDVVEIHEDGRHIGTISNGGPTRVDWYDVGPSLLATLDAARTEAQRMREALVPEEHPYDDGYAVGRAAERAAIVRWLRIEATRVWDSYASSGRTSEGNAVEHAALEVEHGAGESDRERGRRMLESIQPKPRTTVKRFAWDLKARIDRAASGFDQTGQDVFVAGMRYVLGIVDAALSDYDVRDPEDMRG